MATPEKRSSLIDHADLKKKLTERMGSYLQNPNQPRLVKGEVKVRLTGNFLKEVSVREFTFISDTTEDLGGTNRAPRPLEYLLAGVALAEMATIVANAIEMDIRLDRLEVGAMGHRDLRGIYEIGGARPQFQEVAFDVDIDSNADEERIKTLISRSEGRCPGYNTLKNPVKVSTSISLNGKRVETT